MPVDGKFEDALERARAEHAAAEAQAPAQREQAAQDQFREMQRDMAEKVDRAEAMGDRVERGPGTMEPDEPSPASRGPREDQG